MTLYAALLGVLFCLLFSAFNATQNLQSTVNEEIGNVSLSVLYIVFAFSNFFAPSIVMKIGEKWSIILGSLAYVLYIAANIHPMLATHIIAGALNGLGAAIIWTAQGSYLIKCSSEETVGAFSGIFFGIFQFNQIIGNFSAGFLLDKLSISTFYLFIILTAVGGFSVLAFFFLRDPKNFPNAEIKPPTPLKERVVKSIAVFSEARMLLFVLIIIFSGFSQSFFFGRFPKLIGDLSYIGYVLACLGAADSLGSFLFGKLIDKIGSKLVMGFGVLVVLVQTSILLIVPLDTLREHMWSFFVLGIGFGLADASFYTTIYATVSALFKDRIEMGFAAFRFVQSASTALLFFLNSRIDLVPAILLLNVPLIVGYLSYFLLDLCVAPVDNTVKKSEQYDNL
jgi:MFS family permease